MFRDSSGGKVLLSLHSASDFPQLFYEHSGAQTYKKIKDSGVYCRDMAGLLLSGSLSAVGEGKRKLQTFHGGHGDGMDYGLPSAGLCSC